MLEYQVTPKRDDEWEGQQAMSAMGSMLLRDECVVLGPEGKSIIYLPGAAREASREHWAGFSRLVGSEESGRAGFSAGGAWRGWGGILPYFVHIGLLLKQYAPDRYAEQMKLPALVAGTPFQEFTVNGTGYPSVIHHDKPAGDIFSTLGVMRRGSFTGGRLVFPEFGVGVDMQDGDVILLRAHERHGITPLHCGHCGARLLAPGHDCGGGRSPERISVVGTV